MPRSTMMLFLLFILLLNSQEILGRRGRGRGKTRSRVQIGLPITGKYRDPESDQYYNNHNVRRFINDSDLHNFSLNSLITLSKNVYLGSKNNIGITL